MPIRQLAPDVAAKIAAGEVVERPASVVKELIENSIDAGATQIRVDLAHGGLQLIRVTDNGSGISIDELPLALSRHATSKVSQIDDLEHIHTLGFRGEALASLAAVAEVTLLSRHRDAEQGAQIHAINGLLAEVTTAASPEGTTLTVRNLFSSVPARLKFLKSRTTEISHCHHLLEQYALAYPEIRFSVFSDGKQIFATPGDGQLTSVLVEVYGLQIADQMVPVGIQALPNHSDDLEYPLVTGYVSRPTCYKSTRQFISFFVNRRWVLSRMLTSAVEGAYHSLLLSGRHPIAVLNIQIDPTLLDVNVHPAKTEIRFLKERRVFASVLRAVRQALLEEPTMPQWMSHDTATPYAEIDEPKPSDDTDVTTVGTDASRPHPDDTDTEEHPLPQDNPWLTVTEEESGTKPPPPSRLWQNHVRTTENGQNKTGTPPVPSVGTDAARPIDLSTTDEDAMNRSLQVPTSTYKDTTAPIQQDTLLGQTYAQQIRHLPHLRVVGQLSQSYIVTEGDDGMYLIDQHAAHERILLERMVAAMQARTPISQLLLTPMDLSLAPSELETVEEYQQQLTQIGFSLEITESNTLAVLAVPSILVKHMNIRSLHEMLIELIAQDNLGHTETWEERALANVACKAAIKANYFLTVSEMREMIEQLEQTKAPYSCCHGRPTMVHFGLSALAHEFERR
ncbi:MAG: DNA mismatch repair endonuclease MutL [Ktedonobacteraceae bacterium]